MTTNLPCPRRQQKLLEQDRLLVPLLAYEQKLHGRPLDAAVPHQVDQVDQHRQRDQRQTPPEQGIEDEAGHGGGEVGFNAW